MAKEKIIVGLDVGTCNIRVAVAQIRERALPQILGVGQVVSGGMRKGVVVDMEEVVKNIKEAVQMAERISGVKIEDAFVSIGGSHIACRQSKGVIAVSRADGEISEEDKQRAISAAKAVSLQPNGKFCIFCRGASSLTVRRRLRSRSVCRESGWKLTR